MKTLRPLLPCLPLYGFLFYLLPGYVVSSYLRDEVPATTVVLAVLALACCFGGIVFGLRRKSALLFGVFIGVLFVPSALLYYRSAALVYTLGYALLAAAGGALGKLLRQFGA